MSQSPTAAFEACKEQRDFPYKNARLPEENSSSWRRVPTFSHVPRILSSVLGTGVAFYKYAKPRYSPLRTLHRIFQRRVPGQAGRQVVQGVDPSKV